jgi:cell division protein ZapA (FtsZ GTPase activity inhibitor)
VYRLVAQPLIRMKEEDEDIKNITVYVTGRPYPLRISTADELVIRKIVKEVNDKISHFQLTYTHKDMQDCVTMALLTYAVDLYKSSSEASENPGLEQSLSRLENLLDELIA